MTDRSPYPPPRHVLRDLGPVVEHRPDGTSRVEMVAGDAVRGPSGGVRAGVLGFLVDVVGGGLAALTVQPDWIATADLTLHSSRPATGSRIEGVAGVLRAGRTTVVLEVALADEHGACGAATMTFARLPRRPDVNPQLARDDDGVLRMDVADAGSGFREPVDRALGIRVEAPGTVELPITDYVRNSFGALQGGVIAEVVDAAARAALGPARGRGVETVDLQLTYLAPARRGPVRARAEVVVAGPDRGWADVTLTDVGADGRCTTRARVVTGVDR